MTAHSSLQGLPVYDDNGNFVDVEVVSGQRGTDRTGQALGWQDDFSESVDGVVTHDYQDYVDPESPQATGFDWDGYIDDVIAVEPEIERALDAVAKDVPQELADAWDSIIHKDNPSEADLQEFHRIKDIFLQLYQEGDYPLAGAEEPAGSKEPDEFEPPSEDEFNSAMETLYSEQADSEVVTDWRSAAKSYLASGDEVAAACAEASALFHEGSFSQETLINVLAEKYDHRELARVYRMFEAM